MKMNDLILDFPNQIKQAVEIGRKRDFKTKDITFNNVVISGLGGSGIGGKIVSQMVSGEMTIPVITNNDYHLPNFVDKKTLVIISSYSGNSWRPASKSKFWIEQPATIVHPTFIRINFGCV